MVLQLLLAAALAGDPGGVVEGVFRQQAQRDREIAGASFTARFRYVETDLRAGGERVSECDRRVLMRRYEQQRHEYGSVSVNGRTLQGAARSREIRDLRARGMAARNTRMPFFTETRAEYRYDVTGPDTWRGMTVWYVAFEPVRPTARHVRGFARVHVQSFDVVSLDFIPCNLPFVVTGARMVLEYGLLQGYWLPVHFEMDMDLRLVVFVEVMRRHIRVEDDYSDYRLNVELPETLQDDED